jgi:hypothetical protein
MGTDDMDTDMGTGGELGPAGDRRENPAERQPREDMAFPEDFRKLMRRIFGPWNRKR